MTERDFIILGLGDAELLMWWEQFGYCPHPRLELRLAAILKDGVSREWRREPVRKAPGVRYYPPKPQSAIERVA